MSENDSDQRIRSLTIQIIKEKKPETIRQLINLLKKEVDIPEERLFLVIQELEDEKSIQFNEIVFPESITEYLFSFRATWYWTILFLSIVTIFLIFTIPSNLIPQIYVRSILSMIFILYFPGYTLIKAIYPIRLPLETQSITLDNIERTALSVGLSIAVIPFIGLVLYFTPWGPDLTLITLGIFAVTAAFSILAIWRDYNARKTLFLRMLILVCKYELSENSVKFFDAGGLFKNRLVLIKQIPINEITSVESHGNELSITSNGVTNLFLMRYDPVSVRELCEKIRSLS